MFKTLFRTACAIAILGISSSANGFSSDEIDFFDFTGWNHADVFGQGQVFTDICGDLDVVVTGVSNSFTTSFAGDDILIGGNTDS